MGRKRGKNGKEERGIKINEEKYGKKLRRLGEGTAEAKGMGERGENKKWEKKILTNLWRLGERRRELKTTGRQGEENYGGGKVWGNGERR